MVGDEGRSRSRIKPDREVALKPPKFKSLLKDAEPGPAAQNHLDSATDRGSPLPHLILPAGYDTGGEWHPAKELLECSVTFGRSPIGPLSGNTSQQSADLETKLTSVSVVCLVQQLTLTQQSARGTLAIARLHACSAPRFQP